MSKNYCPDNDPPNCWLCSGATVENSVIFEYSRLGSDVRLVDKLSFRALLR